MAFHDAYKPNGISVDSGLITEARPDRLSATLWGSGTTTVTNKYTGEQTTFVHAYMPAQKASTDSLGDMFASYGKYPRLHGFQMYRDMFRAEFTRPGANMTSPKGPEATSFYVAELNHNGELIPGAIATVRILPANYIDGYYSKRLCHIGNAPAITLDNPQLNLNTMFLGNIAKISHVTSPTSGGLGAILHGVHKFLNSYSNNGVPMDQIVADARAGFHPEQLCLYTEDQARRADVRQVWEKAGFEPITDSYGRTPFWYNHPYNNQGYITTHTKLYTQLLNREIPQLNQIS